MKQFSTYQLMSIEMSRQILPKKENVKIKPPADQIWLIREGGFRIMDSTQREWNVNSREILFFPAGSLYTIMPVDTTHIYCFQYFSLLPLLKDIYRNRFEEVVSLPGHSFYP